MSVRFANKPKRHLVRTAAENLVNAAYKRYEAQGRKAEFIARYCTGCKVDEKDEVL